MCGLQPRAAYFNYIVNTISHFVRLTIRPVTNLGHQVGRRVFWEEPKFFKVCRIVSNYAQHIFPREEKKIWGGILPHCTPPGYGPAYNQRRLTIELIRQARYNRLLEKVKQNVANQRKHKFYKRWCHEMRYRGPPVKIAPDPLAFNPALLGRRVAGHPRIRSWDYTALLI